MTEGLSIVDCCRQGPARSARRAREGFTILELQISLSVLVTGLLSMAWLLSAQGKQMTRAEAWCRDGPTYYVLNQPNRWMRKLDATAELKTQPGAEPWRPAVSGTQQYELLMDYCLVNLNSQAVTVRVNQRLIED